MAQKARSSIRKLVHARLRHKDAGSDSTDTGSEVTGVNACRLRDTGSEIMYKLGK